MTAIPTKAVGEKEKARSKRIAKLEAEADKKPPWTVRANGSLIDAAPESSLRRLDQRG